MAYKTVTNYANKKNYGAYRNTSKIKYIVWHYTAVDNAPAKNFGIGFHNRITKTSAHMFVDDSTVVISVPDNYVAYSVGGSRYSDYKQTGGAKLYGKANNSNTLNIELCDTIKNGKLDVSEKTVENAIELTREKMKQYNVPLSHVIRHFDVNGKHCPAYFMDEAKWQEIKGRIAGNMNAKVYMHDGLDYAPVFNPTYYVNRYPDVKTAIGNNSSKLFEHFCSYGMAEARQAAVSFNPAAYRNNYPDLNSAYGYNWPEYYRHYIMFGKGEKRTAV